MATATLEITAPIPSGTNITGLVPHQGLNFEEEVEVYRGLVRLMPGNSPGPHIDVTPGTTPSFGDIILTGNQPDLMIGEVLFMKVSTVYKTIIAAPKFVPNAGESGASQEGTFECLVWSEQEGKNLLAPTSAELTLREGPDTVVKAFAPSVTFNPDGIFTFSDPAVTLTKGRVYTLKLGLMVEGATLSAIRSFAFH